MTTQTVSPVKETDPNGMITAAFYRATRMLSEAETMARRLRGERAAAIATLRDDYGHSVADIAMITGLTEQRVHQLITQGRTYIVSDLMERGL